MRVLTALLLVALANAQMEPLLNPPQSIPGKYIVKLKDDVNVDSIASDLIVAGGRIGHVYRSVLNGFSVEMPPNILDLVRRLPEVEYIEEDGIMRLPEPDVSEVAPEADSDVIPWGLDRIDQRDLPLDRVPFQPSNTGAGTIVYVLGTGIYDQHVDFGGRAYQAVNFVGYENNTDLNGHGTHAAGIIGSKTYGVAKGVNLIGVKVVDTDGIYSLSNILNGFEWIWNDAVGKKAISFMSFSYSKGSNTLDDVVRIFDGAGIPTVAPSGYNGHYDGSACWESPAREPAAITVASISVGDNRSKFASTGSCVDIFAPGAQVKSTWNLDPHDTKFISGGSAAAHVAGALALYGSSSAMMSQATRGKVKDAGNGTPNELLYIN